MNRRGEPPRRIDRPEPGHFSVRLVRGGPWVAAEIIYEVPLWRATIEGRPCGAADTDPAKADGVYRIWVGGRRIDEAEYRKLLKADHGHPPDKKADVGSIPPTF